MGFLLHATKEILTNAFLSCSTMAADVFSLIFRVPSWYLIPGERSHNEEVSLERGDGKVTVVFQGKLTRAV